MNRNDFLKISKQLYLQQKIAKQLYAAFNPEKDYIEGLGSYARIAENLKSLFYGFIGSQQRDGYEFPQIIKKDGLNFTIYLLNLDNTVSNEIYKNKTFNLEQVYFQLRKIFVTLAQGKGSNIGVMIKDIQNKWNHPSTKKGYYYNQLKTISDSLDKIKDILVGMNTLLVQSHPLVSKILSLKVKVDDLYKDLTQKHEQKIEEISKRLKNNKQEFQKQTDALTIEQLKQLQFQKKGITPQFNEFIKQFKLFNDSKSNVRYTIQMALHRLKSIIEIYKKAKSLYKDTNQSTNTVISIIIDAIEKCNTNLELSEEMSKINAKSILENNYDYLAKQDLSLYSFLRFLKNFDNAKIEMDMFWNAIDFYQSNDSLSEQAKNFINQLQMQATNIEKQVSNNENTDYKSHIGKENIFYGQDFSLQLKNKLKQLKDELL